MKKKSWKSFVSFSLAWAASHHIHFRDRSLYRSSRPGFELDELDSFGVLKISLASYSYYFFLHICCPLYFSPIHI